jgi:hypothetical protein
MQCQVRRCFGSGCIGSNALVDDKQQRAAACGVLFTAFAPQKIAPWAIGRQMPQEIRFGCLLSYNEFRNHMELIMGTLDGSSSSC